MHGLELKRVDTETSQIKTYKSLILGQPVKVRSAAFRVAHKMHFQDTDVTKRVRALDYF